MKLKWLFLSLFLTACATHSPTVVKVPVYEKPKFDMPKRPTLLSVGGDYDQTIKNLELDCLSLVQYSTELESILQTIKN